jgi:hypothetical protein
MIIRNASKTALLTGQNAAGQRRAIAHDHPEPTLPPIEKPSGLVLMMVYFYSRGSAAPA